MDRVRLIGTAGTGNSGLRCPAAAGPGADDGAAAAAEPAAVPSRTHAVTTVPLAIQEAITVRHVLLLDYRDRHDAVSVREVEPVAFAGTQTHWYLMAWCRLRGSARAFRADRILAATDTGQPAPCRSYADLDLDIPAALVRRPDLAG
jgi:predicted DNA-binding transcriptional regulator YafY